jgi:uncharacterized protein (TIGR04255 family)
VPIDRAPDLADYENPPVDEVAIGVALWPTGITWDLIGNYWQHVREEYPNVQYVPRLPIVREVLAGPPGAGGPPTAQLLVHQFPGFAGGGPTPPPLPNPNQRTWFISPDDSYLIQIQDDAFLYNWRRRTTSDYPRFSPLYDRFWSLFSAFRDVLREAEVEVRIQQIEVTYFNWIPNESLAEIFRPAGATDVSLPPSAASDDLHIDSLPETQTWVGSYRVYRSNQPIARLRIETAEAFRITPAAQGQQISLQFRAPVAPGTPDDLVQELMGIGRTSIVSAFSRLMLETAQNRWGVR